MIEKFLLDSAVIIMRKCDIDIILPTKNRIFNDIKQEKEDHIKPDGVEVGTLSNDGDDTRSGNWR